MPYLPAIILGGIDMGRTTMSSMERRMDKFDSLVSEYLRKSKYTTSDLAYQVQIDPSTLWRYRKRVRYFELAPFGKITQILRIAGCTTDILRFICGL